MSSNGLAFTATGEIAGLQRSATAMGLQNTALFATGAVAPLLFAAVVSRFGWQAALISLGVLALAGWIVLRPLESQERAGWRAVEASAPSAQ
jgi:MFS family permease